MGASTHIPGLFATQSSPSMYRYLHPWYGDATPFALARCLGVAFDSRFSSLRASPVRVCVKLANRFIRGIDSLGKGIIEGANAKGKVPWK